MITVILFAARPNRMFSEILPFQVSTRNITERSDQKVYRLSEILYKAISQLPERIISIYVLFDNEFYALAPNKKKKILQPRCTRAVNTVSILLILAVNVSREWTVLVAEEVKPKVSYIMCVVFLSIVHSCRRLLFIPLHCFAS